MKRARRRGSKPAEGGRAEGGRAEDGPAGGGPAGDRWTAFHRSVRSLRVRNYRLFFIGHTVSTSGTWMQRVAQDWLVYELTGDAVAVGVATALQFAPVMLLGLWGGVLADRLDRRKALAACQAAQLVLALVLGVVTLSGGATVWLVFLMSLLLGLVTVVDQPVRQAFVSDLVERDTYANAQVFNSTAHNLGRFVGPALAGVVIATSGAGVAFLINAGSFVALLVGLWLMDPAAMQRRPRLPRERGQVRAGLRYVWREPALRTTMWLLVVVALLGQNYRVVFPVAAVELFDGDAATYGWLMAMLGLGAIVGAVTSAARERATLRGLILATLAFAATSAALAGTSGLALAAVVTVGLGVAHFSFNTLTRTVLLLTGDLEMHGRIMALHGLVFLGGHAVGGPILGWVCTQFGARAGLLLAAGSALVAAVVAVGMHRLARRRPSQPATSIPAGAEPAPNRP